MSSDWKAWPNNKLKWLGALLALTLIVLKLLFLLFANPQQTEQVFGNVVTYAQRLASHPADAGPLPRDDSPLPFPDAGVNDPPRDPGLRLAITPGSVRIGKRLSITFGTDRSGYLSLWSMGASGKATRLYPPARQMPRNPAGARHSIGPFQAVYPPGKEWLVLLWTQEAGAQPASYPRANTVLRRQLRRLVADGSDHVSLLERGYEVLP